MILQSQHISIVLVETSHPGNIGSTARAMKNMGLSKLVLVNPKKFPHGDARALAGNALDVLESARVTSSLAEAIGEAKLVLLPQLGKEVLAGQAPMQKMPLKKSLSLLMQIKRLL